MKRLGLPYAASLSDLPLTLWTRLCYRSRKMKRSLTLLATVLVSMSMAAQTSELPKELKTLDYFTGKWATKDTAKDAPSCKYMGQWVLGKRYMQMNVSGTLMGMTFDGILMVTYDESRKQYATTWFDSLAGQVMTGYGDWKGQSLTTITEAEEINGQKMRIRATMTKKTDDSWVYDVSGGDGDKWESFVNFTYFKVK